MIAYFVSSGEISLDTTVLGRGYSGRSKGLNDPRMMFVRGLGPIPCGVWTMGLETHHPNLGPHTIPLEPRKGTKTEGRTGFFIHGDNVKGDNSASSGCIVLPPKIRTRLASAVAGGDVALYVFP